LIQAILDAKEEAKHVLKQRRKPKKGKKPYITCEIIRLVNERDRLFREYNRAREDRESCREKFIHIRNQVNREILSSKTAYYQNKFQKNFRDTKNTWNIINEVIGRKKKISVDVIVEHFCAVQELNSVVNCFSKNMIAQIDDLIHTFERKLFKNKKSRSVCQSIFVPDLSKPGLEQILNSRIKKFKAPGIDGITANDIIAKDDDFLESILMVINQSTEHSIVPKSLKQSVVRPIYKNGPHADYNNYRPISLLPLLSKIQEAHIFEVMVNFLAKHSIIDPQQFGFQKEKGANDLLVIFANTLNTSLNNHIHVLATFVDFSKAFDT